MIKELVLVMGARLTNLINKYMKKNDLIVRNGPFTGMKYIKQSFGSALLPKLIGCYEKELHDIFYQHVLNGKYQHVLNIGCGEGYYAVGLALKIPEITVFAFDKEPVARELCKNLAVANHVLKRIRIMGECTRLELKKWAVQNKPFIICDVEGDELELLQPELIPELLLCDMLVELHDFKDKNISKTILSRFTHSHEIKIVDSTERKPEEFAILNGFTPEEQKLAVNEFRPTVMQWAFMQKKAVVNP